jgi:hypothetical protein
MPDEPAHAIEDFFDTEGTRYLTVFSVPVDILCWRWHGLISDENIESGFWRIVDYIHDWPSDYVIADLSELVGGWGRLQAKMVNEVQLRLAHKRTIAALVSGLNADHLTQWSLNQVLKIMPGRSKAFVTFEEARAWITSLAQAKQ